MKFLLAALLITYSTSSRAQTTATYFADLNSLRSILQKTPSYKDQVKGEELKQYDELFNKLKSDTGSLTVGNKYFYNLASLFYPIKDNHLGFYETFDNNVFKDRASYETYMSTTKFKDFPTVNLDIDSLKDVSGNKPIDSVEGIYHLDTMLTVAVFRTGRQDYTGVILESKISVWYNRIWKRGQIALHLYEYLPNYFKAIYADPYLKRLILFSNEKFRNGQLINSHFYGNLYKFNYSKQLAGKDFVNLPQGRDEFSFSNIGPEIQYLHIKHFSADNEAIKRSDAFYDSIKNLLTAPNLIIDLRNNQGGAMKVSKKFLKLIDQYVKKGRVYVLVNNGTFSQGEIFTLQLKQLKNVQVLGQTTNGTLTYGSNYGKKEKLPSNAFEVYITDMEGDERLIPYEINGVDPDIVLRDDRDWIEQAVEIIKKKK